MSLLLHPDPRTSLSKTILVIDPLNQTGGTTGLDFIRSSGKTDTHTLIGESKPPSITSRFDDLGLCSSKSTNPPIQRDSDLLIRSPGRRFQVLQQFEGVVTDLTNEEFTADLIDLTDTSRPREVAEIARTEISPADHPLLAIGCIFYWIIGYEMSKGGQKSRVSEIRFRRNPVWSQHEIEEINAEGQKLYEEFGGDQKDAS